MSTLKKAKSFKKSRTGTYLSIGSTLFGAIGVIKQVRKGRAERDTLLLADAVLSAAAIATGVALLVRDLRRFDHNDVLAD